MIVAKNDQLILSIKNLSVVYGQGARAHTAVKDVSIDIARGESYGLIGESGSGKTTIAFSVLRYLKGGSSTGAILFEGQDLLSMQEAELPAIRGRRIAVVYQDPQGALNPQMTVGSQVAEAVRRRPDIASGDVADRVVELFEEVQLPDPETIVRRYPHQLSGGQQQRVVIAMALAGAPELLIMDEPTTGLDVTTEAVILDLIADLRRKRNLSLLFISHNLAVVAKVCDRVGVLLSGRLVEEGPVAQVMRRPVQSYTRELVAAAPRLPRAGEVSQEEPPAKAVSAEAPILRVDGLVKAFRGRGGLFSPAIPPVIAVDRVSLDIAAAETLAVVGESGSGKSTLARCIAGLADIDDGTLQFDGKPLARAASARTIRQRREIQIIFQNPEAALNPRHTVGNIIARPLRLYGLRSGEAAIRERVIELMAAIRLDERHYDAFPWQLSGGQKQRVSVARAFAAEPRLIVCDEPTSALDISVQARLLEELKELQHTSGTAYLFISHDLGVVNAIAHRVAVMQSGKIVEAGTAAQIFRKPAHPYTQRLIASVPRLELPETEAA